MTLGEARQLVRSSFLETLPALEVAPRLRETVRLEGPTLHIAGRRYPLPQSRTVRVVSIGKAALPMFQTLSEILPGIRLCGVVSSPEPPPAPTEGVECFVGGHPVPNEQSWQAAESALALLQWKNAVPPVSPGSPVSDDLVLFLVSGGGSAMLDKPLAPSVSLDDLRQLHRVLVACGAPIQDMNALRKHLSAVKGGRLAERAAPASQVTLYVSDVPERLPSAVASGPSMPDETTVADCLRIVHDYALLDKVTGSLRLLLESGAIAETPKPDHPCFARSRYHCLLSNSTAVSTFARLLRSRGVRVVLENGCDGWEYRRAVDYLLNRLERLRLEDPGRPVAILSGDELSCPMPAGGPFASIGVGGRNQAFALYCSSRIAGKPFVVFSAGTDGVDGNSPAAGAIADGGATRRAASLQLDPEDFLRRFDSHTFFARLGDAIHTGPTATNVRDLRVVLAYG